MRNGHAEFIQEKFIQPAAEKIESTASGLVENIIQPVMEKGEELRQGIKTTLDPVVQPIEEALAPAVEKVSNMQMIGGAIKLPGQLLETYDQLQGDAAQAVGEYTKMPVTAALVLGMLAPDGLPGIPNLPGPAMRLTKVRKGGMRAGEEAARATMYTPRGRSLIFDFYKERGLIPDNFKAGNFDELTQELTEGFTGTSQRELTQYLKDVGYQGPKLSYSKTKGVTVDKGDFSRRTLTKPQEAFIEQNLERIRPGFMKAYKRAVNQEKKAMEAFNRYLKKQYGIAFDMGHLAPAASAQGGVYGLRGTTSEPAFVNRAMGDIERPLTKYADEIGMTTNTVDDMYAWLLEQEKLGVVDSEYLTVADRLAVDAGADPNQLIALRRLQLREGKDIPTRLQQVTGEKEAEKLLRFYFGDKTFDQVRQIASELKARSKKSK